VHDKLRLTATLRVHLRHRNQGKSLVDCKQHEEYICRDQIAWATQTSFSLALVLQFYFMRKKCVQEDNFRNVGMRFSLYELNTINSSI
jgi:hypothetical protein